MSEVTGAAGEALSCWSPRLPGRGRPRAAHTVWGTSRAGGGGPQAHCGGPPPTGGPWRAVQSSTKGTGWSRGGAQGGPLRQGTVPTGAAAAITAAASATAAAEEGEVATQDGGGGAGRLV